MLASVKTAAQNTDLISSLQEFAGTENVSKFWIGINRPNPYTDNWNWNIGGTTCPVDDKYGKQYFKESFKLEMVKNRNWQFQIGNFKLANYRHRVVTGAEFLGDILCSLSEFLSKF